MKNEIHTTPREASDGCDVGTCYPEGRSRVVNVGIVQTRSGKGDCYVGSCFPDGTGNGDPDARVLRGYGDEVEDVMGFFGKKLVASVSNKT